MITQSKMAKAEIEVIKSEHIDLSVDGNNNDSINNNHDKCSGNVTEICSGKYQLRPRSLKARRLSDSDWSFQESVVRHKPRTPPLSRYRRKTANARERYRMRQINTAFESLRGVLPSWVCRRRPASEMTKITTLKLASAYIRSLQDILDGNATQDTCSWLLSSLLEDTTRSEEPQVTQYYPTNNIPIKTQQPSMHTTSDSDLMSFLCSASDSGVFQDSLESFTYLSTETDTEGVSLLLLGSEPTRCWGQAQHPPPVS